MVKNMSATERACTHTHIQCLIQSLTNTKSGTWLVLNKCLFYLFPFYFFLFKVLSPLFCFLSALIFFKIFFNHVNTSFISSVFYFFYFS